MLSVLKTIFSLFWRIMFLVAVMFFIWNDNIIGVKIILSLAVLLIALLLYQNKIIATKVEFYRRNTVLNKAAFAGTDTNRMQSKTENKSQEPQQQG